MAADPQLHDRLFLLDGSSLAFRAFFALPESISTQDGQPTNALFGLSQMLLKIVSEYRPACIVCAWDAREKTFRDALYDQYKAQRPSMPDALSAQWSLLPELMEGFGIANLVKPGYEADDILGTLAEEAKRQGIGSIVVTGDRDAMQVVDEDIWVMSTGRGVTDVKIYTPAAVLERFGVTPAQIPDYIGLKGDSSDNIPGVPGVGEKTAAQLLQQFGSIDELYRRLDEVKSDKRRALLAEHEDDARLSLQLATMVLDVPLEHDLVELVATCGYRLPVETVDAVFARFEFANLRRRLARSRRGAARGRARERRRRAACGWRRSRTSAPWPRCWRRVRPRSPSSRAATNGDLVVAAHAGGEACLVAPADVGRAGSLWPLAGHAVVHDAKALPGFVRAPVGRRSTPPWRPTCWRRSAGEGAHAVRARRRRGWRPADGRTGGRGRRGHARHAHVARGRGAAAAPAWSSGSSGCSARSSCRSFASSRTWRPPASRWTRTGWARSRRACATASTSSATRSSGSPAARSPSARRSSWPRCCSSSSA